MPSRPRGGTLLESRLFLFGASIVYTAALAYCLAGYASVEWAEFGHSFGGYDLVELLVIGVALAVWSAVLPTHMKDPGSVVLVLVFAAVGIPGLVVPLGLERADEGAYLGLAIWIIVSFTACCCVVRSLEPRTMAVTRSCPSLLLHAILATWGILLVVLVTNYASVMTLVSLDAIYEQREAGAATSRTMGYAQVYFGYVLSPALVAFGLVRRQYLLVILGTVGGIVLYSITAEKTSFALPFMMLTFNVLFTRSSSVFRSAGFVALGLGVLLAVSTFQHANNLVAAFLAWYIGVRSLLTPGLFVAQYRDFFADWGHTHLSHVTGFGVLVPPPAGPASNPRWPSIGHLVGEQYIGMPNLNANANFVASDGIASFGDGGVLVAFALLAAFLVVLNRAARGVPARFAMLIAFPLGLTLSNGSVMTVMVSFGGLLWIVIFAMVFVSRPADLTGRRGRPGVAAARGEAAAIP